MLIQDELAKLLIGVNVREVSLASGVSTKTIYRLRHKANPPNLATVAKVMGALKKLQRKSRRVVTAAD